MSGIPRTQSRHTLAVESESAASLEQTEAVFGEPWSGSQRRQVVLYRQTKPCGTFAT